MFVSNAGIAPSPRRDVLEMTPESFDRVLGVNLRGALFLAQRTARAMLEATPDATPRSLVFVTSQSATMASVERAEYCISKAGASMAARVLAVRLATHGIGVYEVRPGIIRTDMTAGVAAKYDRLIAAGLVPQGRWGEPDDIARVVAAIARGDLAYSTGGVIEVDGGLALPRL
jgi:NAD(P)-dependent dehydrogenase (short-subunit alcohol dehydrogenase family)